MRSYPRNSPEAAARIVALVLISDGHVCRSEVEALQRLRIEPELGLANGGFAPLVHTLCEDLLLGACATGSLTGHVDDATLASLMGEVDKPDLQLKVLRLAEAAAAADRHLADAEAVIMAAARKHWGIADSDTAGLAQGPKALLTAA